MAKATKDQMISALYAAFYDRAPDQDGLKFWEEKAQGPDDKQTFYELADGFANHPAFFTQYQGMSNEDFVKAIYQNVSGYPGDAEGVSFWVEQLGSESRAHVVADMVYGFLNAELTHDNFPDLSDDELAAAQKRQDAVTNKADVGLYYVHALQGDTNFSPDTDLTNPVAVMNDPAWQKAKMAIDGVSDTPESKEAAIEEISKIANTYVLTNGTDEAIAMHFDAPLVYTPGGDDRINSLQNEDKLTGKGDNADLHVELGNRNDNGGWTVTPELHNIKTIDIDWTGNTNTLDLRNSDSVENFNIDMMTADAGAVTVQNIYSKLDKVSISNVHDNGNSITFDYVDGVLAAKDDTLDLSMKNDLLQTVTFQVNGGGTDEGFENVNLHAENNVDMRGLSVSDMENLKIDGSGSLKIENLIWTANEYDAFAPALVNPGAAVMRTIDMSDYSGKSDIDASAVSVAWADPANSGQTVFTQVTGGSGDNTFRVNGVADNATKGASIDGGEGNDTLVSYSGSIAASGKASISNVESLELRDQAGLGSTNFDAFDSALTHVLMRDENADGFGTTFTLNNLSADLAANGLQLNHSVTDTPAAVPTVIANLKDASGNDDTVALTVVNDLNRTTTFNYNLNAKNVENVTIHDNDTESNTLNLGSATQHTGTFTLDGGTAGTTYTVAQTLNSKVVDASGDASDLRLSVGDTVAPIAPISQDVRLGTGDDILTFANIDEFSSGDKLSDAGGNDTVRAAFSKDSSLDLSGIENLQVTATANVKLDMANADVDQLVLLSNTAVDNTGGAADLDNNGVQEPFGIVSSNPVNIIELDNSKLSQLNFFADNDTLDANNNAFTPDDVKVHTFNGVKLTNNTADDITVNINSSLDYVNDGTLRYTIGQITSHGNKTMNIVVGDEDQETTVSAATARTAGNGTFINNIYAKTMESLSATAWGNLNLGTVSGNTLNNSLKTFDMSKVGGAVTATIISLGDNAVVTLNDGDDNVSGLGSAGKNVTFNAGNGDNVITGTAQSDHINTGTGNDTVAGDRGDNIIKTGAGNDTVTAKEGSDTVDLGAGMDSYTDNWNSGFSGATATNTVAKTDGAAAVVLDTTGTGVAAIDQYIAVGQGSDLTISWLGNTLQAASTVLDGSLANVYVGGSGASQVTANADLNVITTGGVETIAGSAGNDVAIFTASAAGDGLNFSGGTGNDAAVGTIDNDIFNGGAGADVLVMQDTTTALDGKTDNVVIHDGESTASAYDRVVSFDTTGTGSLLAAAGAGTAGADVLDLDGTTIAPAAAATGLANNITLADGTVINQYSVSATGVVSFIDTASAVHAVGTANNEVALNDALAALATELNTTGNTVMFEYDYNGDGVMTSADSTFVFQDGVHDTVVELAGLVGTPGLEAVGAGTNGIEIG